MSIFTRRKKTVSLTIEEDAIRFVRLKSLDPLVVDVAEEVPLPLNVVADGKIVDSENLAAILEGLLKPWGIARRPVQFLAPDSYVIIRKVGYPTDVKEEDLKGYFFIEIGSTLYLPFDDPVFDVVKYTPSTETNEAIIIASKESVLAGYEKVLENVKLDPLVADIAPLALYRLAYAQHRFTGKEHVLIADLQKGKMTVSIFHEHFPLFMRPVELETSFFPGASVGDTVPLGSIVGELEKLINFYRYNLWNGTASITHILINGDYVSMNELLQVIRERLDVQASTLLKRPLQLATGQSLPAAFNRTIGLALKEV